MARAKTQKYTVMKIHKIFWHYQFMRENSSSAKYWLSFAFISFNLVCMFRAVLVKEEMLERLELMPSVFCLVGGVGNFTASFPRHKLLYKVVSDIQRQYDQQITSPKNRRILETCHEEADLVFKVFGVAIVCTGVGFATTPLFIYLYQIRSKGFSRVMLPFEAIYPWELSGTILILSYILQTLVLFFILTMVIINVATPVSLSMAIISHFKMAQERFKEIQGDNSVELLKVAIKCHQTALELLINVRKVEHSKILLQVITTAIALSMCLFRIIKASSVETIVIFGTVTGSCIAHLYILCFYGQKVSNEGTKLYETITKVPWEQQPVVFQKIHQFCIMRARGVVRLSAWNIADISLETFNRVMTTSFSYLTFLQAVSE